MHLIQMKGTDEEKEKLFLWRNDPESRKNSLQSDEITYAEHCSWFERKMADSNCYMYMAEMDDQLVGQVRIESRKEEGMISYSVAPEFRRKGIGTKILHLMEQQSELQGKVKRFVATVKEENIASRRCFEKLGYQARHEHGMYYYTKLNKLGDSIMYALVIGASREAVFAIERAKKFGFEVIAFDGDKNALGLYCADQHYVTYISDWKNIVEICQEKNIVPTVMLPIPVGRCLTTAGRVNDYYHLAGVSYTMADICTDKYKFHKELEKNGLRKAWCQCLDEISDMLSEDKFPAIIKPRYGSGNRGVSVVRSMDELLELQKNLPDHEDYIIETMADGVEYGIDGAVIDGQVTTILIRKKFFVEQQEKHCAGYLSEVDENIYELVNDHLTKVAHALQLNQCLFHADIIVHRNEVFVVELSPRPSGHYLHNLFTPLATGVDMIDEYIKYTLGEKTYNFRTDKIKKMLIGFFDFNKCVVDNVPDPQMVIDKYHLCRYECKIQKGDHIDEELGNYSFLERGYFVAEGDREEELERIWNEVKNEFTITTI